MPASAGPISPARPVPPSIALFPCAISRSSSPTSSGRTTRCEAKYGGMNAPSTATKPSSIGKLRTPSEWRSGIAAISGTRAMSDTSMVARPPNRSTTAPLGIPRSAIGAICTARTTLIFPGEPVVTRTNHGSARYVIRDPSVEMTSATTRAPTAVLFTGCTAEIIKRPYGFVK